MDLPNNQPVSQSGEKLKVIAVTAGFTILLATGVIWAFSDKLSIKSYYPASTQVTVAHLNNNGDYAGAQKFLLEKMKTDSSPETALLLAASYLEEGSVRGTQAEASKKAQSILFSIEKAYKSTYLYDLIGFSYEIVGDFDKALSYYNRALMEDGKSVNSIYSMGHTYWLKGDLVKAKEYYDKAEKEINNKTDSSVIVKIFVGQGVTSNDPKKAEYSFLKAIPLADSKPFKAGLYANLSQAKYQQKDLNKAMEYADLAIKTDPSNELGYIAYAKSALPNKTFLQANAQKIEEYIIKAIFLDPRKAESQYLMGKFDFIFGKYDLAIKSYDTAREFIPNDYSLSKTGKDVLMSEVLFDEAVAYAFNKDLKYKSFLIEAFRYNPAKTLYMIENNPSLKAQMTGVILSRSK